MNKKLTFILFTLFCFTTFIFPQSITVTDPAKDEIVNIGTAYTIRWTQTGTMNANVKIRLFNSSGTTWIKDIVDSTPNDNSYKTTSTIFNGVSPGNYVIRVRTVDNGPGDFSEIFELANPAPQSSITITTPEKDVNWQRGSEHDIEWDKSGTMGANVKITLHRYYTSTGASSTVTSTIAATTGNDCSFPWDIPSGINPATYVIRIRTTDNNVTGFSEKFKIIKAISTTLQQTAPKPPSTYNRSNRSGILYTSAKPYIKSADISYDSYSSYGICRGTYHQNLKFTIGNSGVGKTKDLNIKLSLKRIRGIGSQIIWITANHLFAPNDFKDIFPGQTTIGEWVYNTNHPGIFQNKLEIFLGDKLVKTETSNLEIKGYPDLELNNVVTKLKHKINHVVIMEANVRNAGHADSGTFYIAIYDGKSRIQSYAMSNIKEKKFSKIRLQFLWTKAIAKISVFVNFNGKVKELTPYNNVISMTMTEYTDWSIPNPIKVIHYQRDYYKNF